MKYIATFDLGTTAIKFVILDETQKVVYFDEKEVTTINDGKHIEQNPEEWYKIFKELSRKFFESGFDNNEIEGIICSGQMQDLIMVDKNGNSLSNAILYNDNRGESGLSKMSNQTIQSIIKKTGNVFNGTMPLTKLLWIKNNKKSLYKDIYKILNSAKDYINTKLTGEFASDVTSLSTSGMMDIINKEYISEVDELNINKSMLPKICFADELAGKVTPLASKETGFMTGTKVYIGSGDAGATTLASGISNSGEININLGTSGWVASLSKSINENVFNLSAINRNLYINVIPVLNAGNVHKWLANVMDGTKQKYDVLHDAIKKSVPNSNNLFFLPYIVGERFPVTDSKIRGCYIGINANTTKADIIRSTLEGVAFSIKQCLISLNIKPKKISLIGGGAKDDLWNQIFADVLGVDIIVYENSKFLPSMALASVVLFSEKKIKTYNDFVNKLINNTKTTEYKYNIENNKIYNIGYQKYIKIYPSVKNLF